MVSERAVTVSQRNRRSDTNALMVGYVVDFMSFVCCICSGSIAYRPGIKSVISLRTGSDKMHLVIRQIGFFVPRGKQGVHRTM
jgi:hypothetical protein